MVLPLLFLTVLGIGHSELYQSYNKHSNHNPSYTFISSGKCETGLRESGYAIAPNNRLFLKQINTDGTVGPVCRN